MAVVAVLLTAPLGALAASLLGPVLLKKSNPDASTDSDAGDQSSNKEEEDYFQVKTVPVEPGYLGKSGIYYGTRQSFCSLQEHVHLCGVLL